VKLTRNPLPFVSVIIPAYNEELHIRRCLESVLTLDWPQENMEILLIDNGSTDTTGEIAEKLLTVNGRGKVIRKVGGTIAAVRNHGWRNTRGEVLSFLDADCVVEKHWIRNGVELLMAAKDISCIGFAAAPPEHGDSWVEQNWFPLSSSGKQKGTKEVRWLSSFNLLLRREYFERIGGFNESLITCEDADLGNRLSTISRLIFSDRCHVKHLGAAKSIKQFLLKEYWRGQNSMNSFLQAKNKLSELPSIIVPIGYVLMVLCWLTSIVIFFSFGHGGLWLAGVSLLLILLPVILALRVGIRTLRGLTFASALNILYLIARGTAGVRIRL
jgi:glycosyltransferase involved in cell wall biosynthesis